MIPLQLSLDLDETPWDDLDERTPSGMLTAIGALPRGTESGKTSLALRVELDNGETVIAQTTLALFATAFFGLRGRYAEELAEYPPT